MNFSSQYVGIPFKSRGRAKDGADCWGLVRIVYQEQFNICLPSYENDYKSSHNIIETRELIEQHSKSWISIIPGKEQLGDIIVLRLSGFPTHVGVVVENGKMLHVIDGANAVVENYHSRLWSCRVIGFFRHKELVDGK